jgi:hypothetical protein
MSKYNWIEKIDFQKVSTPITVKRDRDYFPNLKETLFALISELEISGASKKIVTAIKNCVERVIESIELYYQGNLVDAQLIINQMIADFGDTDPAVTDINGSIAFPGGGPDYSEVQFFRARLSENVVEFSADDMLHIPFNMRHIVKSERFSIPGLPCLYLGNSTYDCWVEMGCPADHRFNVAPVILDNSQKVLNLTVTMSSLLAFNEETEAMEEKEEEDHIINLLKLMILTIGTSYKVNEENRNFKSEYILPQMIMLACKSRKLDGITYYSKQIPYEGFACTVGVNLVLFATFDGEESLSSICDHLEIGTSLNFAMFKQLLPCQTYKDYNLRISSSPYINNVGTKSHWFPYRETQFYEFDKYLFANWSRTKTFEASLSCFK